MSIGVYLDAADRFRVRDEHQDSPANLNGSISLNQLIDHSKEVCLGS